MSTAIAQPVSRAAPLTSYRAAISSRSSASAASAIADVEAGRVGAHIVLEP
jgi:hypothetical protein